MKKKSNIILIFVLLTFMLVFVFTTFGTWVFRYDKYLSWMPNSDLVMPEIEDLGEYENLVVRFKHKQLFFFSSDTIVLYVQYDETEYEQKKANMYEEYNLLEEPVIIDDDYMMPEVETTLNGYHIFVVDNSNGIYSDCWDEDYCFPKHFGMIGHNDETKELIYMFFYDPDLDLIAWSYESPQGKLSEFITEYFRFNR